MRPRVQVPFSAESIPRTQERGSVPVSAKKNSVPYVCRTYFRGHFILVLLLLITHAKGTFELLGFVLQAYRVIGLDSSSVNVPEQSVAFGATCAILVLVIPSPSRNACT